MEIQWPLLIFSILLGISSGMFVFLAIGEIKDKFKDVRFLGALIAFICLAVGGLASVLHMGHPERATHLLANIGSGLSMELIAVALTGISALVYLILAKRNYAGASKAFGVITGFFGLVLPLVTGASYLMASRPAWDNFTLPLMYLGAGLAAGFLLMCALVLRSQKGKDEGRFALQLAFVGVIILVATVIAYLIWVAVAPYQEWHRSLMRLVAGDLAIAFWLGVVIIGLVAPVALVVLAHKKAGDDGSEWSTTPQELSMRLFIAFGCAVAGSAVLRALVYVIGTSVEQFIYK